MRNYPNIVNAYRIARGDFNDCGKAMPGGKWAIARPLGFASLWTRFRCAWMVFTGRADVLIWPGQE